MPSLLILAPPPTPHSRDLLSAAYLPPLTAALKAISFPDYSIPAPILTIVVPSALLRGPPYGQKQLPWTKAQSLLAHIYSIIAVILAREKLRVDARVVLVDYEKGRPFAGEREWSFRANGTVVGDLRAFVGSWYPWERLFRVDTEAGIAVFWKFLEVVEGRYVITQAQIETVPGGLSLSIAGKDVEWGERDGKGYGVVCIGGTFDHLHVGHKLLLSAGVLLLKLGQGEKAELVVGVTGDEMLRNKKFAEFIEPWPVRAWSVIRFVASVLDTREVRGRLEPKISIVEESDGHLVAGFREGTVRVRCVAIQDGFGPTITEEEMDVLVVSGETREGGKAVNEKRVELGWRALEVYEVDVLEAREEEGGREGFEGKISSTAIREEEARRRSAGKL